VTSKTKFRISITGFSIEFEGSQDLGQQIHQGVTKAIGGLMNTPDRLLSESPQEPREVIDGKISDADPVKPNGQHNRETSSDKPKLPRQRRSRGGPSIPSLLLTLKQERFFSQPRSSGEVLNHLKDNKAHNLPESSVRTELSRMVKKQPDDPAKLYRTKNESGDYIYKDTPFDEGERSPSSTEQLAE
jgi:hypothetical protein